MTPDQILSKIIFDPPRWPGGPVICAIANLPAFETWALAEAFHEANAPGSRITRKWECEHCKWWHYDSIPRPPSGDSSGTGRKYRGAKGAF